MADMFSPEERSAIMSRIRAKNTVAEKLVFQYLRKQKIYFQQHYSKAPGKPDIALPRKKLAVFVDGDFWHGRGADTVSRLPKEYWQEKIRRNIQRDLENENELVSAGWQILRVWESDIKRKRTRDAELEKIAEFLGQ